ncbi:probable 2-oxoglutarate-dependent dioxygenase AOP1 [Cornus florida]|uniref:probable 2-oxoglutarate-dependent dioxygenase AOP1 n=1 Tax=Cornus florida TaxID=4283 RepID=UPI00289EEB19|nr:probable 2-oxoglutarate-dependent dioxygenase AOP1 [Cornus florida]
MPTLKEILHKFVIQHLKAHQQLHIKKISCLNPSLPKKEKTMGSEALLPVIDLSELKPGTPEWDSVRPRVEQALQEYGCFQALFNKVPFELRKSMLGAMEEIFELPLQTKSRFFCAKTPFGGYTAHSPTTPWESMNIGNVHIPDNLTSFTNLLWPEGNPSSCKILRSYTEQLSELDQTIRRMVLESFGVDQKYCDEHIDLSRYTLRVMKYEGPETMESKLLLRPHSDKNLLGILYQLNEVHGLEVQSKDGKWINVKPLPDSFIVMAGDSFHALTNGHVHAPVHRVVMTENETRYSVGLFSSPKEGHIVKVPDELVNEEHPLRFKPFEYMEYLKFFATEKGQKSHECGIKVFCGI